MSRRQDVSSSGTRVFTNIVFILLILFLLTKLWIFLYFPSQDGASHFENADIILKYNQAEQSVYKKYYQLNTKFDPTWFLHLIMAGALSVFPLILAEKVLLSVYIILFALSVLYALRGVNREAGFLAVLAFPFIDNYLFHLGFYSYSFALPLFFFFVGFWWKHKDRLRWIRAVPLALLSLILYFFHLVPWGMAVVTFTVLAVWITVLDMTGEKKEQRSGGLVFKNDLRKRLFIPLLVFVPTLAAVFLFVSSRETIITSQFLGRSGLRKLMTIDTLISYDFYEKYISTALFCLFALICIRILWQKAKTRHLNREDGFFIVAFVFTVIYFAAPDVILKSAHGMVGGSMIKERTNLFPYFALLLWFASHKYKKSFRQSIHITAVILSLCFILLHSIKYYELNDYLAEYLSAAPLIKQESVVLPVSFSHKGKTLEGKEISPRIRTFLHLASRIAVEREVVELLNYEATTGYFPLLYRPDLNPYHHLPAEGILESEEPELDIMGYQERTGVRIDYVLLWWAPMAKKMPSKRKALESILSQLEDDYELIYSSPERNLVSLYRRKRMEKYDGVSP